MRIGIDLRPFYTGSRFRGIGFFVRNMLTELLRLDQENEYHFLNVYGDYPQGLPANERCFIHSYYAGPIVVDCGERSLYRIPELEQVREAQVRNFLRDSKIDIMLFPSPNEYGGMYRAEWFQGVHTAAIVYDLIPLVFPEQFLFDPVYKEDYMQSLEFVKGMDCLLTDSCSTRNDIIKYLKFPGEKVTVIHGGIDGKFLDVNGRDYYHSRVAGRERRDYFLFAGGIDFKKNIDGIIEAFASLQPALREDLDLIIVGKASPDTIQHYMDTAARHHIAEQVICTGFVSDEELIALYCGAKALIFPSLYEGFGLPVIEAMACGTPVVTSNGSSLREIAEGFALLVNPESTNEICSAMRRVLTRPDEIREMVQRAVGHAREFTWENVARRTCDALERLAEQPPQPQAAGRFRVSDADLAAIAREHSKWNISFTPVIRHRVAGELAALETGGQFPAYPCGKRVFFDVTIAHDWLKHNYVTGIGRVCHALYCELRGMADVTAVCTEDAEGRFRFHPVDMTTYEAGKETVEIRPGDVYFMPEFQVRGVQIPNRYPHPSYLRGMGVKAYAVIHDILPLLMPQYFEEKTGKEFQRYVKEIFADYDGILTVSKTVADEVLQYYAAHPEWETDHLVKLGWFHNGVDYKDSRTQAGTVAPEVSKFFSEQAFLMVGTVEPRKGHQLVFDAFEYLWNRGCQARLCFIGRVGWNMQDFVERIKRHPENGRRFLFLEGAPDHVLEYAYTYSSALIQASAGEGFGLPLIEAGSYGLPVICSDIPVFREVAGENALYFDRGRMELLQDIVESFDARLKKGEVPDSRKIEGVSWGETACCVANMILADVDWYKEIQPGGRITDAEQGETVYRLLTSPKRSRGTETTVKDLRNSEQTILLVHPNNFLRGGQGENNRTLSVVRLLKELGYEIDLFSFENFSADSTFASYDDDNEEGLIRNLYLYDFATGYKEEQARRQRFTKNKYLQDWTRPGMHLLFKEAVSQHRYAAVGVFYTYLANLFVDTEFDARKIYFMEDCMFIQQSSWSNENPLLGPILDEELEKMAAFDEFLCISYDEKNMYEKMTGRQMHFFPHILPANRHLVTTPVENRKYDVVFVGADNPFNVEGLQWFVDEVCPLLDKNIKVAFVGSVTRKLDRVPTCAEVISFAPNLDELFDDAKVSICPMFRGTGMKIKVVESMAYGVPVVCNERGVDGLPDKTVSGCIVTNDAAEFAEAINRLVRDTGFYREKAAQIRAYYRSTFDREQYIKTLRKVLGQ